MVRDKWDRLYSQGHYKEITADDLIKADSARLDAVMSNNIRPQKFKKRLYLQVQPKELSDKLIYAAEHETYVKIKNLARYFGMSDKDMNNRVEAFAEKNDMILQKVKSAGSLLIHRT